MGVFKKASKYRKPLSKLKIKEDFLNQELKRTGMLSEIMSTSKMYYDVASQTPAVEEVLTAVPDPNGIRDNGSGNASDIDPSDSSTWANGGQGLSHLMNTNTLPVTNGDDVSNVPVVATPDVSGFSEFDTNQPYAGIIKGGVWGVWGTSYGVIGPGNEAHVILAAFGWPQGGENPSDRGYGGFYRTDTDAVYNARVRMKEQVQSYGSAFYDANNWKTVKAWVEFNDYGFGTSWANYKAASNTIWKGGETTTAMAYVSLGVYVGHSNNYTSTVATPQNIILRDNDGLGDPGFFPGPIQSWLMKKLKLSKQGAEYLLDKGAVGTGNIEGNPDPDGDQAWGKKKETKWPERGTTWGNKVYQEAGFVDYGMYPGGAEAFEKKYGMSPEDAKKFYETGEMPQSSLPGDTQVASSDLPDGTEVAGITKTDAKVLVDIIKGGKGNVDGAIETLRDNMSPSNFEKLMLKLASGGGGGDDTQVAATYGGEAQSKKDQMYKDLGWEKGKVLPANFGGNSNPGRGMGDRWYPGKDQVKSKKKGTHVAHYEPEGDVLSEGWQSPEHVNVDKDERKRWFKEKDILPEYPKKAPPKQVNGWHPSLVDKPIDNPTIKITDEELIRNHRLTDKEVKEWKDTINALNAYIDANPAELIHARQRYPVSDPRLAELNWKMDTMLGATEEFLDKKYPENTRLFNQLQKSVKRSIKLTDPTTFKVKIGKETSYKKLLNVDYITHAYSPTAQKEIKVKVKQDKDKKKSAARFFRKERKKSKSEILDLRIKQLDIDMSKTLTNP